jgi:hypothetical protein
VITVKRNESAGRGEALRCGPGRELCTAIDPILVFLRRI